MSNKINTSGSLGYEGKVSIHLQKNGRKYKVHESSNQGLPKLFNGLCKVLAGQSDLANVVPARIALYALDSSDLSTESSWEELYSQDHLVPATPLYPVESSSVEAAGSIAHVQSKVLYGHIYQDRVHIIALYPITASSNLDYDSALAFYKLLNNGSWDEVSIDRTSFDNTFIIDWQLSFSNV